MSVELIGKTVNGYEIVSQVGQGGMATVFLARQRSMNRNVALKFLPGVFVNDDTYLQRFEREVKIVSQLEHRNIVPVYDYGEFDGQPYIAMRYMPAGSVEELLAEGRIPLPRVLSIVEQVAAALDYAHQQGILHRDLKPSNILLDDGGGVFITDFGIARILSEGSNNITTQGVVGTPSYMSPEQAQAEPMDGRSDVYSLGVMLFELVSGRRPFESDTPYSIAVMHVTMPPPSPREFKPTVSIALEAVILRALRKKAVERFGSAGQLAQALRLAVDEPERGLDTGAAPEPAATELQNAAAQVPIPAVESSAAYDTSPVKGLPRRRQRKGMWVGMAAGGALGCALLVALMVAGVSLFGVLSRNSGMAVTPTIGSTIGGRETTVASERNTVDISASATSEIEEDPLRSTLSALNAAADATFTAEAHARKSQPTHTPSSVQPVGERGRPTLYPELQSVTGELVYFADRESDAEGNPVYNIINLDLVSGETRRIGTVGETSTFPLSSPDGRWLAFQSDRDGDFEIYVSNRSGGQLRQLTVNAVWDRLAAWSPDGEWIIYSSDRRGDQTFDLYRIRPNGTEEQPIYSDGWRNSHARFSSDGQYIVFTSGPDVRDASTWEIRIYNLRTGGTKLLTENDVRDASPTFSPDSQRIIYVTTIGGVRSLASMNLDGENRSILFTGPGSVWSANYSPDGEFIVLTSTLNGRDQLFLMDAAGGNVQQITSSGGAYASWIPRFSGE